MFDLAPFVEKSFEMWPGVLRIAAAGPGAHGAVEAGIDAAREVAASLMSDAELLTRGSVDVLPRGLAARGLLEAVRELMPLLPVEAMPPLLVGLPGAVCDVVLAAMRGVGDIEFASATLCDSSAFYRVGAVSDDVLAGLPLMAVEFLRGLSADCVSGGIAFGGTGRFFPTSGVADLVATLGDGAGISALSAAALADAMVWPQARVNRRRIVDPLVAAAYADRDSVYLSGVIPPDEIWETLSKAMRAASRLREKRVLIAAAFAFKGRGRTAGPVAGDRLLRFGVSEWR